MKYSDYIKTVAERMSISQTETKELVQQSLEVIVKSLNSGDKFTIPHLGTFGTKVKDSHRSYNPHYEKFMLLPKKRIITYAPSSSIKDEFKDTRTN